MTFEEFQTPMDRIVKAFDPHKWNTERETEYYNIVKYWSIARWESVASESIRKCKRFPYPSEILECADAMDKTGQRIERKTGSPLGHEADACSNCHRGAVYFEREKEGLLYEKYAACDCAAGDHVAKHMVKLADAAGKGMSLSQVRYSYIFPTA